jgi:hypothetical protein
MVVNSGNKTRVRGPERILQLVKHMTLRESASVEKSNPADVIVSDGIAVELTLDVSGVRGAEHL